MLTVEDVSYGISDRQILNSVSFSLMPGNKVVLVGENGAGKSTLLKIIMEEISADEGKIIKPFSVGYVPQVIINEPSVMDGVSVLEFMLEEKGLNKLLRDIKENTKLMDSNLSSDKLEKAITDYSHAHEEFISRGGYEAESEIQTLLSGVGLVIEMDVEVKKLSGGEKTRLAFARSIFSNCDLLILDEPTNHIDRQYYGWLGSYLKQTSKTILVVSHHPEFIDPFAQRIIEIEKLTGRAREYQGTYEEYLEQSVINEKTLRRRMDLLNKDIDRLGETAMRLQYGGPNKAKAAQNAFKRIERMKNEKDTLASNLLKKERLLRFRLPVSELSGQIVLKVNRLKKSFPPRILFQNVSFTISRGEKFFVSGVNGSGKTTLLKLIMGLIKADEGSVEFGHNVRLGYYAQEHENLDFNATVMSEVQDACRETPGNLRNILARFLFFQDKVFQEVNTLSPGERSRLSLCKLMLGKNNLLVLDEPTNYLDPTSRNMVAEAIQDYEGTVIFVSHDKEFIRLVKPNRILTLPLGLIDDFEVNY